MLFFQRETSEESTKTVSAKDFDDDRQQEMVAETISETTTDNIEIPTENPAFMTVVSSKKMSTNDCDKDR